MTTPATSRRDLLRAASTAIAYASGAAIVGTGMALASEAHGETIVATAAAASPAWDAAFANWQHHRAAFHAKLDAFNVAETAYFANRNDVTDAEYQRADAEQERFSRYDDEAMKRLIETPAPDLHAVALKLDLIDGYQLDMKPAIADVLRLAGKA